MIVEIDLAQDLVATIKAKNNICGSWVISWLEGGFCNDAS
jgi:hypothetical protein